MKKVFAFILTAFLAIASCAVMSACKEDTVSVEEIKIVATEAKEYKAGETFTLSYTTVPEDAAEKITVNWNISDSQKLSYKDGSFTALTCGTVKVTASVKGGEATDEIELKVIAPDGFKEYSDTGYKLVYPSSWTSSALGKIQTWTAANGTTSMNVSTEELKESYFTATAASYQSVIETTYSLMGYTVNFTEPVSAKKATYLGVERVQVDYRYTLQISVITTTIHQTQLIINNTDENLSCILTVTFWEENFDEAAAKLQETVFSQFMPA